jgi:hypothetical protein
MHTSTRQPRGEIGVGMEFGAELVVGGEEADVADFKNSSWDRCGQSHRVTPIPRGPIRRCTPVAAKKQPLLGAWLQAGWSVSGEFSYQKNFPAPHSGARDRGLPPVEGGSARHSSTVFPINKTAGRGQEDFRVGHNHALTSFSAKKCAVKDGDFCALDFLPRRFSPPQTGGTTNSGNRGFFTGASRMRGA